MGSGSGSPQKPPGRPKTGIRDQQSKPEGSNYRFDLKTSWISIHQRGSTRNLLPDIWLSSLMSIEDKSDQAERAISTGKLNALRRLHTRPINVVVFHGS